MIDFVEAGGIPDDSSAASQAANSALIADLMDDTNIQSAAITPSGKERGGPHIYFPPGNYYFAGAIRIKKTVHLEGSDAATRAGHQTTFVFPEDSHGIVIDNDDTDALAYVQKPNANPGAAGTVIEGFVVKGSYSPATRDKHGVLVRSYSVLRHIDAQSFGGNGIFVLADLIPEHGVGGQASNSMILGCSGVGNAGSGLRIEGGDANVVNVIGGDYSFNGEWGVADISFLGCNFSAIHMSGNNGGDKGIAMHNGVAWVLRPGGDASANSVEPGTNESVWTRYRGDLPSDPAWAPAHAWSGAPAGRFKSGGAFITAADAARSVWTGCYTEGGQSGAWLGKRAIAIGGDFGSGVFASDLGGNGEPAYLEAIGQEFVTRSNVRMKDLYLGLTRARGDRGTGMRMTARSTLPSIPADAVYTGASYTDYAYFPGDIVWNEGRTATQSGVAPPLGWRCIDSNPPGVFEEIPFPTAGAGTIADNAVTNAKLADMAQARFKGRAAGAGTGDPQDLTPAQARAILASDSNNGALFLAGDGTFKAPPASGAWTIDYVANRPSFYNLTPAHMTHVVFNTSDSGFHRVYLQNVATGTRVKLSSLRGGHPADIACSDAAQVLHREAGSTVNTAIKPGGTVLLTKVGPNLWVGEGDFTA